MLCATKSVNPSHLSQVPPSTPLPTHLLYKIGEDPVSCVHTRGGALLGEQLLHPLTSYSVELPSTVGSPVLFCFLFFYCPVPVIQGYTNRLPVDTWLKLLSPLVCPILTSTSRQPSRNCEKHFGSFSDVFFPQLLFFSPPFLGGKVF